MSDIAETQRALTASILGQINGSDIERALLDLARVGGVQIEGTQEQPERYAVSRLALGEDDERARREVIRPFMEVAGMDVQEHPLGMIGTLYGTQPDLAPIVIISHTDSVPRGDMYDGDLGVIGGIKVVQALSANGVQADRNIHVISMTGEESSAFGFALFGSRGMFHGLTDQELDAHIPGGDSIRATLGAETAEIVKEPIVGPGKMIPTPFAVIELHVEQNNTLDQRGIDLGVVEAIAAPVRFSVEFGDEQLEVDDSQPANARYFRVQVEGKSDHSGATPMGETKRADGLVETAKVVLGAIGQEDGSTKFDIGPVEVDEQALNKIPGRTAVTVRISGDDEASVEMRISLLQELVAERNEVLSQPGKRFKEHAISLTETDAPQVGGFFEHEAMKSRQEAALSLIVGVNEVANACADQQVVGTVGTYTTSPEGKISLGLDIRGINKSSRDSAIAQIQMDALRADGSATANFGNASPGSGDPVVLDDYLVKLTKRLIDDYGIGSSVVMHSAAGHDAQNSSKAGIPTVMIFTQSNAGGIAHHPDAYTNPDNLAQGVRALAALTIKLAT